MVCTAWGYGGDTRRVAGRSVDPSRFVYDTSKATIRLGFTAQYDFRRGLEADAR